MTQQLLCLRHVIGARVADAAPRQARRQDHVLHALLEIHVHASARIGAKRQPGVDVVTVTNELYVEWAMGNDIRGSLSSGG